MRNGVKVVGVTGVIASGKSLVGRILQELGFPVIDTDQIVHDLFENNDQLKSAIASRFGDELLIDGGARIDRVRLGTLVFSDPAARRDLEAIVHPATIAECERRVDELSQGGKPVFVLVPLLFEAKQEHRYDEVWTVQTTENVLRQRLQQRNNYSDEEISKRLAAQLSQFEKVQRANKVIDNSGTIDNTRDQVRKLLGIAVN